MGDKIFYRSEGLARYECETINQAKRLERFIIKSLKNYNITELLTPNTMNNRCRDCLLYHHKLWINKETTLQNYESIALVFIYFNFMWISVSHNLAGRGGLGMGILDSNFFI